MKRHLFTIVLGVLLVAMGLVGGFYAGHRGGAPSSGGHSHGPGGHTHGPGGHTHGPQNTGQKPDKELSPQTLNNLGVVIAGVQPKNYTTFISVQGELERAPLSDRPLVAPLGGFVGQIHKHPGDMLKGGDVVMTIVRDAIPRPEWKLTGNFLKPVNEDLHKTLGSLRAAGRRVQVLTTELERLQKINSDRQKGQPPVVSAQRLIDLRNDLVKAQQALDNARTELHHHGLSDPEIAAAQKGDHVPHSHQLWQRALAVHGLWTRPVEELKNMLPKSAQEQPWCIGTLGELSAGGLVDKQLTEAMAASAAMRSHFVEVASLLLAGSTVARVRVLADQGALDPVIRLRAPAGASDFDVTRVRVRPGEQVRAGQPLVELLDPRKVWLRLHPVGTEILSLRECLRLGRRFEARPLQKGAGPMLRDLSIQRLVADDDGHGKGTAAIVFCANKEQERAGQSSQRTWQLRRGMRYVARIPQRQIKGAFVLPRDAVVDSGPDRIVFHKEAKGFHPHPVHVIFEDAHVVIVANDGAIEPGEEIVVRGAFALSQALQTGSAPASTHSH